VEILWEVKSGHHAPFELTVVIKRVLVHVSTSGSMKDQLPGKFAGCEDDIFCRPVHFEVFCPPVKTRCPPAENLTETPDIDVHGEMSAPLDNLQLSGI